MKCFLTVFPKYKKWLLQQKCIDYACLNIYKYLEIYIYLFTYLFI